jgi:hypothetical protein
MALMERHHSAHPMPDALDEAVAAIVASGQRLDARGLAPATSGNYSVRVDERRIAVTVESLRTPAASIVFLSDQVMKDLL